MPSSKWPPAARSGGGTTGTTSESSGAGASRRSFLAAGAAVGVGAGLGPLGKAATALADRPSWHKTPHDNGAGAPANRPCSHKLPKGDAAILRFLAAAEILETDLWHQYNELGGIQDSEVPGGSGNAAYTKALEVLDEDMPQYIHDNADDELTHFMFLNGYLESRGVEPIDLEPFRTLQGSEASGSGNTKWLTNLRELTIDTSWWARYRSSTKNPDFGDSFPQAVPDLAKGSFPAIPRNNGDLEPEKHIQAIANTAAFHFATIEQGGSSLYPSLAQRVTDPEVLRIMLSIGPTEVMHFQTWSDKAGNAPPLKDPTNGLEFPDLNAPPFGGEEFKTNLIMPEPTIFLRRGLPICSILRPTNTQGVATGVAEFLTNMGLFNGQSSAFFNALKTLAAEADAAKATG
jgi:hypothetical protein